MLEKIRRELEQLDFWDRLYLIARWLWIRQRARLRRVWHQPRPVDFILPAIGAEVGLMLFTFRWPAVEERLLVWTIGNAALVGVAIFPATRRRRRRYHWIGR